MSLRVALRASAVALWALTGWLAVAQAGVPFGIGIGQAGNAQAAFSPLNLSPAFWYDASTFTTDGSTKDGSGNVTEWKDKSGHGLHLTGVSGTPLYTSGAINGLDAIDFEAADSDVLYRDSWGGPTGVGLCVYAVVKPESAPATDRVLFAVCDTGSDDNYTGLFITPKLGWESKSAAATGRALSTGNATAAVVHLLYAEEASTNSRGVILDNTDGGSNATSVSPSGIDRGCVGQLRDATPNAPADGLIGEIVGFAALLDLSDDAALLQYLDEKWDTAAAVVPGGPTGFPLWPVTLGAGLALAALSVRRQSRRCEVLRFPVPEAARRVA